MKNSTAIISHIYHDDDKEQIISEKTHSHYAEEGWHSQTNKEHCEGVARLASEFAAEFDMECWGEILGLLHDRGKESSGFQAYIRRSSGYDIEAYSDKPKEHSKFGAILAHKLPRFDDLYWLSNAIAGHHGGLYDISELEKKLKESVPDEISQKLPEIPFSFPKFRPYPNEASHISRMLFSCLVDADWLDTENFMQPERTDIRGKFASLEELRIRLQKYREDLSFLPSSPLNELRNAIQTKSEEAAQFEPGFFELTVPTGGGKTIASVIWAVNHAIKFNKKRIIIAIPFTSIIVQTAAILRNIFGEENIIEHHSAVNASTEDERTLLACENWDAPVIVTTNVQLFESMFSNRRSACRKLHSLVNSIVILDEVQTLPLTFLQPIVNGMKSYAKLFGTSFLFCTASQPILDGTRKGADMAVFQGIERKYIRSIIDSSFKLHDQLRRVYIDIKSKRYTYETMANTLMNYKRVLCVVNTRHHALELYRELRKINDDGCTDKEEIPTFHLSRSMCSAHLLETIKKIKAILADPQKGLRVISTQLIEAGVDIDFPIVYRQLSGLDSILQAAGRCNREGKLKEGKVTVFSFQEETDRGALRFAADTMKAMIDTYPDADWLSPDIMRKYYEKLYLRTPKFDKEDIGKLLDNPKNCKFEEAANKFSLIDNAGKNIIVNFGEAEQLINKLKYSGPSRKLSRQLGRYSVNIPEHTFKEFCTTGLIEEPFPGFYYIPLATQYDYSMGLKPDNDYLEQFFAI